MNRTVSWWLQISIIILILVIIFTLSSGYQHRSSRKLGSMIDQLIHQSYHMDYQGALKTLEQIKLYWEKDKHIRAITVEEEYIMEFDNYLIQCETAIITENWTLSYQNAKLLKHTLEETLFSTLMNFDNIF